MTPSSKVVGDLALAPRRGRTPTRPTSRRTREKYDIPDSVVGFMAGELGDLPGRLAGAVPHQGARRARRQDRRRRAITDEDRAALDGGRRRAPRRRSTACCSRRRRSTFEQVRELYGDLSRPRHRRLPLRAAARASSTSSRSSTGVQLLRRARGDRRGRRQGHAHRHDHPQRPAAAGVRARPQHRGRRARRPRRPTPRKPGQVAAPFSGVVTLKVERGRHRRGRPDGRVDRGDEDGGGDHRTRRRHGSHGSRSRRRSRWMPATCWSSRRVLSAGSRRARNGVDRGARLN